MDHSSTLLSYMKERQDRDLGAFASAAALVVLLLPIGVYGVNSVSSSSRQIEKNNVLQQGPFIRRSALGKYSSLRYSSQEFLKQKRKDAFFD